MAASACPVIPMAPQRGSGLAVVPKRISENASTKHHVPPRRAAVNPPYRLNKTAKDYRAYRVLFGDAEHDECKRILTDEWWTFPTKGSPASFKLRKPVRLHRAYHQLFRNAGSLEHCFLILDIEWWTYPSQRRFEEETQ